MSLYVVLLQLAYQRGLVVCFFAQLFKGAVFGFTVHAPFLGVAAGFCCTSGFVDDSGGFDQL